eukprot:TRINITY_DN57462_c0_g1_i2.p1 TRINITY_DN57462_c0_g1~~TRINITY_DN57462_c0_g1_i2.p1  ORF type:complete len:406 (-),score=131.82 TRINITY_DN57462_c0_g1_i2:117-1334(-)
MELCTGPDISSYVIERMERGGEAEDSYLPEREVSIILRQCLKSVLCCHAHGFVHRDLNAKNFMLSGVERVVKLIDFGLATRFMGFVPHEKFIEIVGTSHYMAPEMMLEGTYSPAVDIWSMGVLFYVLLTGMMLLPKDDVRKKCLLSKPDYIVKRLQNCKALAKREASEAVRDLLGKMLQRDAKARITAQAALSHPFILSHCHEHLGPPPSRSAVEFDRDLVAKLRRFGKAPRLKKVALLMIAHLADHERGLSQARNVFRAIDADGDGEISLEELKAGIAVQGLEAPGDVEEIFAACDGRSAGKLSFVEFLACALPDSLVDERLCHEAFNLMDRENKGRLGASDLQAVYPAYDLERCEKMVQQADREARGFFDFEDFHVLLRGEDAVVEEPLRLRPRKSYDYDVPS